MKENITDAEFDFLRPDKFRLDEEAVEQPHKVYEYSRKLEKANKRINEKEAEIDVEDAEHSKRVRKKPTKYGLAEKPTEAMIKSECILNPKHRELNAELIQLKYKAGLLKGIMNALEHRKRSIEHLVELHGRAYFATPKITGEAGRSIKDQRENRIAKKGLRR